MDYSWAKNKLKLQRAIAESGTKDEADVMALYKSFGGLVGGRVEKAPERFVEVDETTVAEPTEEESVPEVKIKTPRKTKKNAK